MTATANTNARLTAAEFVEVVERRARSGGLTADHIVRMIDALCGSLADINEHEAKVAIRHVLDVNFCLA